MSRIGPSGVILSGLRITREHNDSGRLETSRPLEITWARLEITRSLEITRAGLEITRSLEITRAGLEMSCCTTKTTFSYSRMEIVILKSSLETACVVLKANGRPQRHGTAGRQLGGHRSRAQRQPHVCLCVRGLSEGSGECE